MFLQIWASEIWVRNISMLLTFVYKLSGISVNKGTNLRLGWTEYSDFMKLSTRPSTLFIFIVCFLTGEQNAGKVYCRSHIKITNTVTCITACICILFKQYSHYDISLFISYFCRWTVYGHCFQQTRSCQNHVSIHSFFSLLYTVSCYPDLEHCGKFLPEIFPGGWVLWISSDENDWSIFLGLKFSTLRFLVEKLGEFFFAGLIKAGTLGVFKTIWSFMALRFSEYNTTKLGVGNSAWDLF